MRPGIAREIAVTFALSALLSGAAAAADPAEPSLEAGAVLRIVRELLADGEFELARAVVQVSEDRLGVGPSRAPGSDAGRERSLVCAAAKNLLLAYVVSIRGGPDRQRVAEFLRLALRPLALYGERTSHAGASGATASGQSISGQSISGQSASGPRASEERDDGRGVQALRDEMQATLRLLVEDSVRSPVGSEQILSWWRRTEHLCRAAGRER